MKFDFETTYAGELVRVQGSVDPGEPATGPTYDCGGTPGCGPTIEDFHIFDEAGKELEDDDEFILSVLEAEIMERAADAHDDAKADAAEARSDRGRDR